jgi:cysteinyl-tRNA synthetase
MKNDNLRLSLQVVAKSRSDCIQQLLLMVGRIVRGDTAYEVGPHYFDIRYESKKYHDANK